MDDDIIKLSINANIEFHTNDQLTILL